MKCPKCEYLGFETGDRCKNCGYDFSLMAAPPPEPLDLSLKDPQPDDSAPHDLWLGHPDDSTGPFSEAHAAEPPATQVPEPRPSRFPASEAPPPESPTPEPAYPLFMRAGEDDEPLIKVPSEPRAPLAVRRTPDLSRSRGTSRPTRKTPIGLTLEFADEASINEARAAAGITETPRPVDGPSPGGLQAPAASLGSRVVAAVIDHSMLFGVDLVVVYCTLRMVALQMGDWDVLPLAPLLAFLVLVKLTYFSAFTAMGGQTIGKMAAGIRVVADDPGRLDPARAVSRTLTSAVSLLSLGLGLVPALFGQERRAFHDRIAHTRVIALPSA